MIIDFDNIKQNRLPFLTVLLSKSFKSTPKHPLYIQLFSITVIKIEKTKLIKYFLDDLEGSSLLS